MAPTIRWRFRNGSMLSTPLLATILDVMEGASTASEAYTAGLKHNAWNMLVLSIGLMAACFTIFVGAIAFSVLTVARPLRALTKPLSELAQGNFMVTVPGLGRGDEIGQIAQAVSAMSDKVRDALVEIKSAAREVTNTSTEISTSTTDLSQRTEEQAASLEETSASMEQISATVKKNAENAQQANQLAAEHPRGRRARRRGGRRRRSKRCRGSRSPRARSPTSSA